MDGGGGEGKSGGDWRRSRMAPPQSGPPARRIGVAHAAPRQSSPSPAPDLPAAVSAPFRLPRIVVNQSESILLQYCSSTIHHPDSPFLVVVVPPTTTACAVQQYRPPVPRRAHPPIEAARRPSSRARLQWSGHSSTEPCPGRERASCCRACGSTPATDDPSQPNRTLDPLRRLLPPPFAPALDTSSTHPSTPPPPTTMSTAVAAAPAPAALAPAVERHVSPRHYASIASAPPSAERAEPAPKRARSNASPTSAAADHALPSDRPGSGKTSPNRCVSPFARSRVSCGTVGLTNLFFCSSLRNGAPPMIKVKKEPGSPSMATSRPRPKRLDLSSSVNGRGPQTARPSAPLTSRDSAGLAIQDMGLACLSPGFQTNDPSMREQLQRSLDVREQQRQLIEARQKGTKPGSSHDSDGPQRTQDNTLFGLQARTPTTSRRKGPPPGLSIAAPSAAQFANDRVIQSAPLHQTFTGLRPGEQPSSRYAQHGPSGLSQMSHIHHVPATQTNNRLPPIADVFANDRLDVQRGPAPSHSPHTHAPPAQPSPGFPPPNLQFAAPMSARQREFRSAEEAMQGLSGGRDDLMPKVVHYGGVQPPTPPSPLPPGSAHQHHLHHPHQPQQPQPQHHTAPGAAFDPPARPDILARTSSMNGRRRGREEFERDNGSSPPRADPGQEAKRAATFAVRGGEEEEQGDWRRGLSSREKREEFLRLCERAWDLFHS